MFQNKELKSVIIHHYIQGMMTFLTNRNVHFIELDGGRIEIFYSSEEILFLIGYHFGRYAEMQNN
jgi:hypothetical protein